jgi:hypothetical protein
VFEYAILRGTTQYDVLPEDRVCANTHQAGMLSNRIACHYHLVTTPPETKHYKLTGN